MNARWVPRPLFRWLKPTRLRFRADCGARLGGKRESKNRDFRGDSTRRASSHSACPSKHDVSGIAVVLRRLGGRGDVTLAYKAPTGTPVWSRSTAWPAASEAATQGVN